MCTMPDSEFEFGNDEGKHSTWKQNGKFERKT